METEEAWGAEQGKKSKAHKLVFEKSTYGEKQKKQTEKRSRPHKADSALTKPDGEECCGSQEGVTDRR